MAAHFPDIESAQGGVDEEMELHVNVDGFEGPLDLLLALAQKQKVDLINISILALVEQYLSFIAQMRRLRLEVAADYLVMASWLTYLKSRLLIPQYEEADEPSGDELAEILALRLKKLEAMRQAADALFQKKRLGKDFFARGAPETVSTLKRTVWQASLYDVLMGYASQRQRSDVPSVEIKKRDVLSLQEAREILERLLGSVAGWAPIENFLKEYGASRQTRATVVASTLSASLEMAKEGKLEIQQTQPFGQILLRTRDREYTP